MKKFEDNIQSIQADPISGEYYLVIPECLMNELSWYEDTQICLTLDGDDIILSENKDD